MDSNIRDCTQGLSDDVAREIKGDTKLYKNDRKEEGQHVIESVKLLYITVLVQEALSKI